MVSKVQQELQKTHKLMELKAWPRVIEKKQCKHGDVACMMPGCKNCDCETDELDLMYLWFYDMAPIICSDCLRSITG